MQLLKIRGFQQPPAAEITPRAVFESRRRLAQALAAGAAFHAVPTLAQTTGRPNKLAALAAGKGDVAGAMTMEKPTAYADITS